MCRPDREAMSVTSSPVNKAMSAVNQVRSRLAGGKKQSILGDDRDLSSHEPVQVEPKTYFANERTFIQWISASLLLLTVSSIMMGTGHYDGTSSTIAFASLVLVCYASFIYFRRVSLLRSGQPYGYLDFVGPAILSVGVGIGVFIVFADAVKGSEFMPWGENDGHGKDDDDRRMLSSSSMSARRNLVTMPQESQMQNFQEVTRLVQVDGKCTRHDIQGINLLEYEPRDISLLKSSMGTGNSDLLVATPQSLVSHYSTSSTQDNSEVLAQFPDAEIQSIVQVDSDRFLALSVGPKATELLEFSTSNRELGRRYVVEATPSKMGSMVLVPASSEQTQQGKNKLLIHLDGSIHTYETTNDFTITRTGSINMKLLNQGGNMEDDHIVAMEQFEGLTYLMRGSSNTMQAWDLTTGTFVGEMDLPRIAAQDSWAGMTLEREDQDSSPSLRASSSSTSKSKITLHMPLDSYPPQLWSFALEEQNGDFLHLAADCN